MKTFHILKGVSLLCWISAFVILSAHLVGSQKLIAGSCLRSLVLNCSILSSASLGPAFISCKCTRVGAFEFSVPSCHLHISHPLPLRSVLQLLLLQLLPPIQLALRPLVLPLPLPLHTAMMDPEKTQILTLKVCVLLISFYLSATVTR